MASLYFDLLTAVTTSVKRVLDNTVLRIKPLVLTQDTIPICVVAPGPQGEQIKYQAFNKVVQYSYPVWVTYVEAENRLLETGIEEYLGTREAIRNQLFQVTNNLGLRCPEYVYDIKFMPSEAVEYAPFLKTNYKATGWLIHYLSSEQRVN